jgi:hypothetical protein
MFGTLGSPCIFNTLANFNIPEVMAADRQSI